MGERAPSSRGWFGELLRDKGTLVPFVVLYMVVFGALALVRGNQEFTMYGIVMVGLIGLVLWWDRRVRFSTLTLWGLAIWGLLHMAGGTIPIGVGPDGRAMVLYGLRVHPDLPRYDQVIHAFGFFVATLASWEALRAAAGTLRPTLGVVIGAALMGMGLGAVNEVLEFGAHLVLPRTGVGGYENTGWDLVSNLTGAALAATLIWWRGRRDRRSETGTRRSED